MILFTQPRSPRADRSNAVSALGAYEGRRCRGIPRSGAAPTRARDRFETHSSGGPPVPPSGPAFDTRPSYGRATGGAVLRLATAGRAVPKRRPSPSLVRRVGDPGMALSPRTRER